MVIPAIFHKYEQKCFEAKPSKQVRSKCTIKSKKFEKTFMLFHDPNEAFRIHV